ncbi:hypothetical protein [Alloalcanivorax gelatiniphagus]|uniref:Uncharacterized protein n=1 Tax=Alloalcanivorax gelatiniphagus TaxID=1194167 RepID=A0ABY2XMZ6_9GAMM|nr:hypothetical protein [Alloalcanivorax gelatiniphagus]TMW13741.1 hypothetical protein FGS76_06335 [Alloalcanivorax gelatiniphagus]
MATMEQLEKALRGAHRAGKAEHARRLASEIRRLRSDEFRPVDTDLTGRLSSYAEAQPPISGLGDILPRIGSSIKLALQEATSFDEQRLMNVLQEEYPGVTFEQDPEGYTVADFTDIGGGRGYLNVPGLDMRDMNQAAMAAVQFSPAGAAAAKGTTLLGQAALGGTVSAGTEVVRDLASQAAGGTEEFSMANLDGWNITAAGAMGAAAPYVARAVEGAVRRIAGKGIRVLNEQGGFTDEAMQTLQAAQAGPEQLSRTVANRLRQQNVLTPEQAQTFNLFRSQGVNATRANLTQSADDWQLQQEAIKRSGPMRGAVDAQDRALAARGEQLIERTGGQTAGPLDTGEQVFSAVTRKATDLDDQISQLYREAYNRVSDDPVIVMGRTVDALRRNAGMNQRSDGTVTAIQSALRDAGVLGQGMRMGGEMVPRRIGTLGTGQREFKPTQISVRLAEKLRQDLNNLYSGANDQGRRIINQVKNALDDDVFGATGEDIFREARAAKSAFHRELETKALSKFDKNTRSLVQDVLENRVAPDRLFEKLVVQKGTRASDLKAMKDYLLSGTEDQVTQGNGAWNSLRAETLRYMIEKATGTAAKTEGGEAVFNGNQFRKAMDRIGGERLRTLFGQDEFMDIAALRKIGELRIPVSMTQQGKGPSAQAVSEIIDELPLGRAARRLFTLRKGMGATRAMNDAVQPGMATERVLNQRLIDPQTAQQGAAVLRQQTSD